MHPELARRLRERYLAPYVWFRWLDQLAADLDLVTVSRNQWAQEAQRLHEALARGASHALLEEQQQEEARNEPAATVKTSLIEMP